MKAGGSNERVENGEGRARRTLAGQGKRKTDGVPSMAIKIRQIVVQVLFTAN